MDFFEELIDLSSPFTRHRNYNSKFRVRPVSQLPNRESMQHGGRILMPVSTLRILSQLNIANPWLFVLKNPTNQQYTHCGVLEFVAEEGRIYVPDQFMDNLNLKAGQVVEVSATDLPSGTFVKFQPQSVDFLDVTNPRALLETALRNYACLTVGDFISIPYGPRIYVMKVVSLGENVEAARIIDCDVVVDFDPPVGYIEETPETRQEKMLSESASKTEAIIQQAIIDQNTSSESIPFAGESTRIDGKKSSRKSFENTKARSNGIPDYSFELGTLRYVRVSPKEKPISENSEDKNKAFSGSGRKIKDKKNH